jgi:hypothetical protein
LLTPLPSSVSGKPEVTRSRPPASISASPSLFARETQISYNLSAPTLVHLTVHDLCGRRIATLTATTLSAGPHLCSWTGDDGTGAAVPSGVYLLRLTSAAGGAVARVTLLR